MRLICGFATLLPRSYYLQYTHTISLMGSQAANQKDYIYGILGLISHGPSLVPNSDYNLSVVEIFRRLTVPFISIHSYLEIICLGNLDSRLDHQERVSILSDENLVGLPSWVPNYAALVQSPQWFMKSLMAFDDVD